MNKEETNSTFVEDHDLNDGLKEDDLSIFVHVHGGSISILKVSKQPWERLGGADLSRFKNMIVVLLCFLLHR